MGGVIGGTGAQRRDPLNGLDFFPTPHWATRGLMAYGLPGQLDGATIWEPCAGAGDMVRPLSEGPASAVIASDIYDHGPGYPLWDFTQSVPTDGLPWLPPAGVDWVITNPPFNQAQEIITQGLAVARVGVAVLVRLAFLESKGRYQTLYRDCPPALVCLFSERVPMVKGRLDPTASTNMAYAWLVWRHDSDCPTRLVWIPPCRGDLTRRGDYPEASAPLLEGA